MAVKARCVLSTKGAFFYRDGNFNRLLQQVYFKIPV